MDEEGGGAHLTQERGMRNTGGGRAYVTQQGRGRRNKGSRVKKKMRKRRKTQNNEENANLEREKNDVKRGTKTEIIKE